MTDVLAPDVVEARRTRARTAKGASRRDALVQAAASVAMELGLGAVTHRAVAARSGLPLGATTYYFADRQHLLWAAASGAAQAELERARLAAARSANAPASLAAILLDVVIGHERLSDPAHVAAYYERVVEVSRLPGPDWTLAPWQDAMLATVADVLARHDCPLSARTALALVDGAVLQALADVHLGQEQLVTALGNLLADATGRGPKRPTDVAAVDERSGHP